MANKCNHNIDDPKSSLKEIKKIEMVFPPCKKFFCPCCQQFYIYTKASDGTLVLDKDDKKS